MTTVLRFELINLITLCSRNQLPNISPMPRLAATHSGRRLLSRRGWRSARRTASRRIQLRCEPVLFKPLLQVCDFCLNCLIRPSSKLTNAREVLPGSRRYLSILLQRYCHSLTHPARCTHPPSYEKTNQRRACERLPRYYTRCGKWFMNRRA